MVYSPRKDSINTHCQCCLKPVAAMTGMIAQHGFKRRYHDGYDHLDIRGQSCIGSRYLPIEVSKDRLPEYIHTWEDHADFLLRHLDQIDAGKVPIFKTFEYEEERKPGQKGRAPKIKKTISFTEKTIVEMILTYPEANIKPYPVEAARYRANVQGRHNDALAFIAELEERERTWKPNMEIAKAWTVVFGDNLFNPPIRFLDDNDENYECNGLSIKMMGEIDKEGYIQLRLTNVYGPDASAKRSKEDDRFAGQRDYEHARGVREKFPTDDFYAHVGD